MLTVVPPPARIFACGCGACVKKDERDKILEWCQGNQAAAEFLRKFGSALQRADDLVDEEWGPEKRAAEMPRLIHELVFGLAADPFYLKFQHALAFQLVHGLLYWDVSNTLAKSAHKESRLFGFVYREYVEQLIPLVAMLCGAGYDKAKEIALDVHNYYHETPLESFEAWEAEHDNGRRR